MLSISLSDMEAAPLKIAIPPPMPVFALLLVIVLRVSVREVPLLAIPPPPP